MSKAKTFIIFAVLIGMFAGWLRFYAAQRLDVDYDEPVYLGAAVEYANDLRQGKFNLLAWSENTFEHPALYKILYGVVLLTQTPLEKFHISDLPRLAPIHSTEARNWAMADRYFSVFLGALSVVVLALFNPVAGLFLTINSLGVKHTSEVYLEALPLLTSLLCAITYLGWFSRVTQDQRNKTRELLWLTGSAIFLGMTAASKYVYAVVGLAVVLHAMIAVIQKQIPFRQFLYFMGWGILSLFMFFVFDPYLWPHPLTRLMKTLLFHVNFQDSNLVKAYNYPFYQPVRWLWDFSMQDTLLRPSSAFVFRIDPVIFILAVLGLPRLFRVNRFFFYWLLVALLFLLVWTTKWPQYTLILLVPYCISASEGINAILEYSKRFFLPRKPYYGTRS